ncbi:hypothetical protein ALC57_05061 [Trachymyrmex cornetzi]|uniref:Uncharacterized protein n=1 Tax=Trachymyrmex cornetzi TaxID=471704 RepID=A0A151JC52_9HYME|nr:hypothetical protein ALC57_05061 [Trachymyrmex cornetzi]
MNVFWLHSARITAAIKLRVQEATIYVHLTHEEHLWEPKVRRSKAKKLSLLYARVPIANTLSPTEVIACLVRTRSYIRLRNINMQI